MKQKIYMKRCSPTGSTVDDYFPSHFDYETPFGQVVRKPLFGDLPRAMWTASTASTARK